MNKILITGCSGFIGFHLTTQLLDSGFEVCGMDIKPLPEKFKYKSTFRFYQEDICNTQLYSILNEKPNETQIHKDAKLLMKTLLDNKNKILFYRECYECLLEENTIFEYKITDNDYNENTIATMEYRFNYNSSNRSADVALVENKDIKYIFEICYKNKTKEENRPEYALL